MKFTCKQCKNIVETEDGDLPATCFFCLDQEMSGQLSPIEQLFENTFKHKYEN